MSLYRSTCLPGSLLCRYFWWQTVNAFRSERNRCSPNESSANSSTKTAMRRGSRGRGDGRTETAPKTQVDHLTTDRRPIDEGRKEGNDGESSSNDGQRDGEESWMTTRQVHVVCCMREAGIFRLLLCWMMTGVCYVPQIGSKNRGFIRS